MAKKEYTSALQGALSQFITTTPPEAEATPEAAKTTKNTAETTEATTTARLVPPAEMEKRKARAKNNAKYINPPPAMYKAVTDKENPRGRQVHLLMRPGTYGELLAIAHGQGRSLNNLIESILIDYLEARGSK